MLGKRIKKVRIKAGLTSSSVARVLEIDLRKYMMIENDEIEINYQVIEKLCLLFGCEEKVLLHDDEIIDVFCLKDVEFEEILDILHFRKIYAQIR